MMHQSFGGTLEGEDYDRVRDAVLQTSFKHTSKMHAHVGMQNADLVIDAECEALARYVLTVIGHKNDGTCGLDDMHRMSKDLSNYVREQAKKHLGVRASGYYGD